MHQTFKTAMIGDGTRKRLGDTVKCYAGVGKIQRIWSRHHMGGFGGSMIFMLIQINETGIVVDAPARYCVSVHPGGL